MVRTQHKQRGYGFVLCMYGGSTRKASRAGNSVVASGLQLNWRQGTAVVTAHGCVGASGNNQVISSISILLRESGLTLPESLVRLRRPNTAARRNGVGVSDASGAEPTGGWPGRFREGFSRCEGQFLIDPGGAVWGAWMVRCHVLLPLVGVPHLFTLHCCRHCSN